MYISRYIFTKLFQCYFILTERCSVMYITRYIFNIFFILPYTLHVTLHFY